MNWKEFLKPDYRKIMIFIALMIITNYLLKGLSGNTEINMSLGPWDRNGYPFVFLYEIQHFLGQPISNTYATSWFPIGTIIIQESSVQILGLNIPLLISDIVIWYVISCFIVWIYDKFRKKK